MALQLVKTNSFALTIPVSIPSEDPKKPITGSFTATFRYRNREQREELLEAMKDGKLDDAAFFASDVIKIDGIGGEDGENLTPDQQKAAVLDRVELCQALFAEFWSHMTGAGAKNSKTSPRRCPAAASDAM